MKYLSGSVNNGINFSFIEAQFPVSKMSRESYKEPKVIQSQTLTGLGKWWEENHSSSLVPLY